MNDSNFRYRNIMTNGDSFQGSKHGTQNGGLLHQNYLASTSPSTAPFKKSDFPPISSFNHSTKDRMNEFLSAVESLRGSRGSRLTRGTNSNSTTPQLPLNRTSSSIIPTRSEFAKEASHIGKDLANTCLKLERLTKLASEQSLFQDHTADIQQLTVMIKEDMNSLNKKIANLQNHAKSTSGSKRQLATHANNVVVTLQSKLANMSNNFKSVLEIRTEALKKQASKRENFTVTTPSMNTSSHSRHHSRQNGFLPLSSSQNVPEGVGSLLLQDDLRARRGSSDISVDMEDLDRSSANGYLQYQAQLTLIDEQDSYLQQRADTMKSIESTIVEMGEIFQQLAFMVKEQGEMVQRIDANIEDTSLNVDLAHSELLKYFKSITSNRWLMFKVFGVLIIFFIIFIVFVA